MDRAQGVGLQLGRNAVVAVAYGLLAWLGKGLALGPSAVAVLWPPVGMSLAAVLAWGPGVWPGIWLGASLQATIGFQPQVGLLGAGLVGVAFGTGAALQALLGGWLVWRRGFGAGFDRVEDVFALLVLGGLVASLVSATLGTAALLSMGLEPEAVAREAWRTWWLGDTLGAILVAPVCLLAARLGEAAPISHWERAAWLASVLATAAANALGWVPVPFLLVPLLVWAALRFSPPRAVLAVALVAIGVVVLTREGLGPLVLESHLDTARELQRYLGAVAVPVLVLIAALAARRRTEEELRCSSSLLNAVIEHIPDTLFLKDLPGLRYVLINRAYEQQVGISRERVLGNPDREVFHPSQASTFEAQDREVLETGGLMDIPLEPVETPLGVRYYHTRKMIIRDGVGQPQYLLGVAEDLTDLQHARAEIRNLAEALSERVAELEQANARLRALDAQKVAFVNSVSHELRTPLTSIVGYAEFLEDLLAGPLTADQRTYVTQIQRSAARLQRLVDDLLDFARIDAGTFTLRFEACDVCEKVDAVAASLRPLVAEARIHLTVTCEAARVPVLVDALRIEQVLANLLTNAVKHTPPEGHVALTAFRADDHLRFEVRDTGPGINPEDMPRLFQRFTQLDALKGGTGLGLSISRALIEAHGGRMGVESEPGQGACFWFTLPLPLAAQKYEPSSK